MSKRIHLLMAIVAILGLTTGPLAAASAPRLRIVATTFPLYDWTRQILGSQLAAVELVQLQDSGVDLHNFQPTVKDIARLAQCDLFIYVGGESDAWAEAALKTRGNPRRVAVNLVQTLGKDVRDEARLEGMEEHHHHHDHDAHHHDEDEDDHDHDAHHDAHHEHGHEHELEKDEHVWLSLRFAARLCETIADRLAQLDTAHADVYRANCRAYVKQLKALDARYAAAVAAAPTKTLLFADRFPFRYLADDYGLTCFAAFSGCSAETEASFKTVAFLAEKVNALKLPAVIVLEGRKHAIAETVVRTSRASGVRILVMDSLQSATSAAAAKGQSYLKAMEGNLQTLQQALGTPQKK